MAPGRPTADDSDHLVCPTVAEWESWLERHHSASPGVWLKIARKGSGIETVHYPEVLDTAITWGWIDARRQSHDDAYFLQRFTPRGPRSKWSQRNRAKATELIEQGRMHEPGLAQVRSAQADGRWDAAYEAQSEATVPDDFQQALDANPAAREFFQTLTGTRRYAFLHRLHHVKTPARRAQRIAKYIVLLNDGKALN